MIAAVGNFHWSKMSRLIVLIVCLLLFGAFAQSAQACTCAPQPLPCESYGVASAVFVGTVTGVREVERSNKKDLDWTPRGFKFSVEQSYLGVAGTEIEVFTGRGGGDCGYPVKRGERYLVYAHKYKDRFTTSICSRTKQFSRATEDLAFLGNLSSLPPGATIYGRIVRNTTPKKDESLNDDVVLRIEGADVRREIRPDANGHYRVAGLPAGKFKVTLQLPEGLTTYQPEREVSISDRGCASLDFSIDENGRLSGSVVDAAGQPVPHILVSVVEPASDPRKRFVTLGRTDDEGHFSFSSLPSGKYLLAVNFEPFPEANRRTNAYPSAFYPGVTDQPDAEVITLAVGENRTGLEIRIPLPQATSILKGRIVWADGSPVAGESLSVGDVTHGDSSARIGVEVDHEGQFKIDGYIGQKLILEASSNRPYVPNAKNRPRERSEPVRITLERPAETAKIVITKLR
jgi:hypothetical protein